MKKIFFLLATITLTTVSCENFLDTQPIDKIDIRQYYTDEAGLTSALAGVYDAMSSANTNAYYQSGLWDTYNVATDEGFYQRNPASGIKINDFNTSDASVQQLWSTFYQGIDRANVLIANINLPQMDEEKRKIILGEALFLRGYYHFMLISYFRNIPLKLTPTTTPNDVYIAQTPPNEVYAQILKDMTDAEGMVSTSTALGYSSRVSKTVVEGILARVCLQMAGYPHNDTSKYADALAWAKKVKDSGEHALNTTFDASLNTTSYSARTVAASPVTYNTYAFTNNAYAQIFINMAQEKYDVKESMWEVEFKGNRGDGFQETGRVGNTIGIPLNTPAFYNTIGMSYGYPMGTARLWEAYKAGDLRRDWALAPFTYTLSTKTGTTTPQIMAERPFAPANHYRSAAKWRRIYEPAIDGTKNSNHTSQNWPILRYADVLLMLAEAENQVNGPTATAYEAVNQVRRRGYGKDINTPDATADLAAGLSQANFQLAVENERYLELCFEGFRRLDLIRWNKYIPVMKSISAEISVNTQATGIRYASIAGQNASERHMIYPIPLKEMGINKLLVQNELWK